MLTPKFDALVQKLQILPSVGQKSAQRMALYLLNKKRHEGLALAQALSEAMQDIVECQHCHSFSDEAVCHICQDARRDAKLLCVVETAADVMAIENSGIYRGYYFVLGGHLSPIDGVGVDELNIDQLITRVSNEEIDEVILATSSTAEGQTTAYFIGEALRGKVERITRLAQGVPIGGELEYLDNLTLSQAIQNRSFL